MLPVPLLKLGAVGIPLVLLGVSMSSAQSFVVDFNQDQEGVFVDAGGLLPVVDWERDSGLDGETGGSVFIELQPGSPLIEMTLGAREAINFTGSGLGDGSNGMGPVGEGELPEYVSVSFDTDVVFDAFNFKGFTLNRGNSSLTDAVDVYRGASFITQFSGNSPSDRGERDFALSLNAGQALFLQQSSGTFYVEGFTFSAVPEPSAFIIGAVGSVFAFLGVHSRKRKQADGQTLTILA